MSWQETPRGQKAMLVVLSTTLLGAAGWRFGKPYLEAARRLELQARGVEGEVAARLAEGAAFEPKRLEELVRETTRLALAVPREGVGEAPPPLDDYLTSYPRSKALELVALQMGAAQLPETRLSHGEIAGNDPFAPRVLALPITLELRGDLGEVLAYLAWLEAHPRRVSLEEATLEQDRTDPAQAHLRLVLHALREFAASLPPGKEEPKEAALWKQPRDPRVRLTPGPAPKPAPAALRFVARVQPALVKQEEAPRLEFKLTGILGQNAVLGVHGQRQLFLEVGQVVDGWALVSVDPAKHEAVFQRGKHRMTIKQQD